jgi:hypothetical protein
VKYLIAMFEAITSTIGTAVVVAHLALLVGYAILVFCAFISGGFIFGIIVAILLRPIREILAALLGPLPGQMK